MLIYDSIPQDLKNLTIWLCYDDRDKESYINYTDQEINDEKKAPRDLTGNKCSYKKSFTFNECIESIEKGFNSGIGLSLTNNGIVAIDYDNVIEGYDVMEQYNLKTPIIKETERARILNDIRLLDTYTEISPSGKGIHIILLANKNIKVNIQKPIEIYTDHFIRLTGNLFNEWLYQTIEDRTPQLEQFLNEYNIKVDDNKSIIKQKGNVYTRLNQQHKYKFKHTNKYNITQIKQTMFEGKKGKQLKQLYDDTITDADYKSIKTKKLDNLLKKGKINREQYEHYYNKIDPTNSGKAITLLFNIYHYCYGDIDKMYKIFIKSKLCKPKYLSKKYANKTENIIQNQFIPFVIKEYTNYLDDKK